MKKQFFIGCTILSMATSIVAPGYIYAAPVGHEVTGSFDTSGSSTTNTTSSSLSGQVDAYSGATTILPTDLSTVSTVSGTPTSAASLTVTSVTTINPLSTIRVTLPVGTVITSSGGSNFDSTSITANSASVTTGLASNESSNGAIQFGISSVSLHFSKPIKIEIPVPGYGASTIPVKVKHGGTSAFVTAGLTNDSTTSCTNGVPSIASNVATVTNFVATIYTCAASTFVAVTTAPITSGGGSSGNSAVSPAVVTSVTPTTTPVTPTTTPTTTSVTPVNNAELEELIADIIPALPPITVEMKDINFQDLNNHWARQYIESMARRGIVAHGKVFNPDNKLSRAEFVKIVVNTVGMTAPAGAAYTGFSDVSDSHTMASFIRIAAIRGLIANNKKMKFRPNDTITRAEAMKILVGVLGADVDSVTGGSFSDVATSSDLAKFIEKARVLGIVSGQKVGSKNLFRPNDSMSRAEIAKVVSNAFKL